MSSVTAWAIRTKSDEAAIEQGCVWDQAAGDRVCTFIENHLTLENGKPFVLLDWQRKFIESVYCWIRPDGRRRVKVALLTLARKNGKTALVAGLTAYHLLADGELKPSCVSCAVDTEQAGQIFESLHWSYKNNSKLRAALNPVPSRKELQYPAKDGKYKSVSSDASGKFGHGHSFVVYDELAFHKNDRVHAALQNSTDSRPNGLQVIISTAGWNKNGVFFRLYQHSKKILAGDILDTGFQPWVYETPDDADLDEPTTWRLANPSLGITLNEEDFRGQWQRVKNDIAGRLDFLRLKFNCWTEGETSWLSPERWELCKGPFPDLTGAPCFIGVDAGQTQDLTAVTAVFPIGGKFYIRSWGIAPKKAAQEREKQNLVSYQRFTLDNSLKLVDGDCVGIEEDLYPLLDTLIKQHQVRAIVIDKWQLLQLSQHYMKKKLAVFEFPPFHSRFNEPTLAVERAVLDGKLVHDGNALLRWQIGHTQLDRDGKGYVKPKKPTAAAKIDNVVSLIMAFSVAMQDGVNAPLPSRYEGAGITVF